MANVDRPNGLVFVRTLDGSTCGVASEYTVDSSNGTAIFIGDPVVQEADGNVAPAGAGGNCVGVVSGIKVDPDNLGRRYVPASTAGTVYVNDNPESLFRIQEDDGGTNLLATSRGALVDATATAGSTTSGMSRYELDQDSILTTSGTYRLFRLIPEVDNDYGDNADWEVQINEHQKLTAAGV
jgi:hypothetical protein